VLLSRFPRFAVFSCLIFLAGILHSQNYRLRTYSEKDGLSQNYIYSIFQDTRGFLWMGTGQGLSCFDGNKFVNYYTRNGLAEDFVTATYLSPDGTIWLGHQMGGITKYGKDLKFRSFAFPDLVSSKIIAITEDAAGNKWFATQRDGLLRLDAGMKPAIFTGDLKSTLVISMANKGKDFVLIGTGEGLMLYDLSGKGNQPELIRIVDEIPPAKIPSISSSGIAGVFWIATDDAGFFRLETGKAGETIFSRQYNVQTDGIKSNKIDYLFEDDEGVLWVAFFGKGFSKFIPDSASRNLKMIPPLNESDVLDNEYIRAIHQDAEGQVWLGTYGNGLVQLRDEIFTLFDAHTDTLSTDVLAVIQDKSSRYWLGTRNGLLQISEQKLLNQFIFFSSQNPLRIIPDLTLSVKNGLPGNHISALYEAENGTIWIGTEENGVASMDPNSYAIKKYELSSNTVNNSINAIIEDKQHRIWVATKGGAYRIKPETGQFDYYSNKDGLPHNNLFGIYCDVNGKIWLGTHSQSITVFENEKFKRQDLNDSVVAILDIVSFIEDDDGALWVATKGNGVFRIKGNQTDNFTTDNGMFSDYCYLLSKDKTGNIWIGHRYGLTKYIKKTRNFVVFDRKYGWPEGETNTNAVVRDQSGNIWFGTPNGLVQYNPIKDRARDKEPNTFITAFKVFGEAQDLSSSQILELPYQKYRLKFEFLGLTFKDQDKVRYLVKLDGNDVGWSEIKTDSIIYQGLAEGKYTFMVKACNFEGVCNSEPVTYTFIIRAPFWKTWWFITGCIVLTAVFLFGFVRYRIMSLQRERKILAEKVEERTAELREEKEKVQVLNRDLEKLVEKRTEQLHIANKDLEFEKAELVKTSEKLKETNHDLDTFLYKMTHDIKGPTASVMGLAQVAKLEVKEEKALEYLDHIEKRITRLDKIVIDLIQYTEITQQKVKPEVFEVNPLVEATMTKLSTRQNFAKVNWEIVIPEKVVVYSDRNMIATIFQNVMDNSMIYADTKKESSWCKVGVIPGPDQLVIRIADNGIGIRGEHHGKIYDMFFKGSHIAGGGGLGLYLVKNAIDKLGGTIELNSKLGEGAEFVFTIPLEKAPEGN